MSDYPAYQYSVFLKGSRDEQLVIRAENWEDFLRLKENADVIIKKVEAPKVTSTPYQAAPVKDIMEGQMCRKCGAKMVLNPKTGNWFCSNKCWLKGTK